MKDSYLLDEQVLMLLFELGPCFVLLYHSVVVFYIWWQLE